MPQTLITEKQTELKKKRSASGFSRIHYVRLAYRSAFFIIYLIAVIAEKLHSAVQDWKSLLSKAIWLVFITEMLFRLFPSKHSSMGCEKQFKKSYSPVSDREPVFTSAGRIIIVAAVWIALTAIVGAFYFLDVISKDMLILICLFFSVSDIICILFFCPFHRFIMKNKCCITCRIYNWDYAMMFIPLIFIPGLYSYSLVVLSLLLLALWEIRAHKYPERFSEATNGNLQCANCGEKLCRYKKRLKK